MTGSARGEMCSIEPLNRGHERAAFSCGVEPLDRYLRRQALQDARRGFAAVFVAVEAGSAAVLGYYALSMASVPIALIPEDLKRKMPRYPTVPAIRLGRLAVLTEARGQGLGTFLLMDAMKRALRAEVAWATFLVDAKDKRAREFYRRFGFESFLDEPRHLYLMRRTIESLFPE